MTTLKRDIAATFSGNVAVTILALGISVILARALGPSARGLFGLAILIPTILSKFCICGQDMVNATFAGLHKDKRSALFQQTLIVTVLGSLLSVLIICAFYFWLPFEKGQFDQLSHRTILLTCLVAPTFLWSNLLINLVRGVGRVSSAVMINIVQYAVRFGLLLAVLVGFKGGLESAILIMALSPLAAVVLAMWNLREYVTLQPKEFSGDFFKKSLVFGTQVCLTTLAGFLVYRIDQGILGYMVSMEEVGMYMVAVGVAERLKILPNSIASAFLPWLANDLSGRQDQVPRVFRLTMVVGIGSMLLISILGAPAILLVYGRAYSGSISPFLMLLPGVTVLVAASVLFSDLATRKKPKYSVYTSYAVLTVNVILNFCLIPYMGISGAAAASSISYILAFSMAIAFYRYESKIAFKEMIPGKKDIADIFKYTVSALKKLKVK